jgi:hypothetical protein
MNPLSIYRDEDGTTDDDVKPVPSGNPNIRVTSLDYD